MENYLLDGRCSISNNAAENTIRPFTVVRKNRLFSNTPKGITASAVVYSLVETVKANGLNVTRYLSNMCCSSCLLPTGVTIRNFWKKLCRGMLKYKNAADDDWGWDTFPFIADGTMLLNAYDVRHSKLIYKHINISPQATNRQPGLLYKKHW